MAQDKAVLITGVVAVIAAIIALVASLGGLDLTGLQTTQQGNATLEVSQNLAINFTTDSIDWGTGRVDQGNNAATLDSEGTVTNSTQNSWNTVSQPLVLENTGNVNATINLSANDDALNFIGGGTGSYPSPEYNWKVTDDEAGSCVNANPGSYSAVTSGGNSIKACDPLKFDDQNDQMALDIEVVVPFDAQPNSKSDTITASATAA